MMTSKRLLAVAVSTALYAPLSAFATNGMNMEGYGPVATAMGGASMAYDNGTAAMANNVATLGMMADGNRVDVALGSLSPDVKNSGSNSYNQTSKADQFFMPAMGWAQKSGKLAFGAGVFAQGGMGTEYNTQLGVKDRSEVGVGRFIIPVAYNVNEALTVGASVDYVWATMDLQMTAPMNQMGQLVNSSTSTLDLSSVPSNYYGRFDFSDNNDYSGKAQGNGFAGKLGMTYKISPAISIGANYQGKTAMGDLETGTSGASMIVYTNTGSQYMKLTGKATVVDFQWPETFAVGMAWQASDAMMVVADVKQIQWSGVMKNFKMSFVADGSNGTYSGKVVNITMPQNWKDQTVLQVGTAYKFSSAFTGRAGLNLSSNPVPDSTVNPLFPAIVENHVMVGAGYAFNAAQDVNFSMTYAPKVEVKSANYGTISHSQMNWQLMYSHRF